LANLPFRLLECPSGGFHTGEAADSAGFVQDVLDAVHSNAQHIKELCHLLGSVLRAATLRRFHTHPHRTAFGLSFTDLPVVEASIRRGVLIEFAAPLLLV
jgi:hypothetical protein